MSNPSLSRRCFLNLGTLSALNTLTPFRSFYGQTMPKMLKRTPSDAEVEQVRRLHMQPTRILFQDDFKDEAAFSRNWSAFKDDRSDLKACRTEASLSVSLDGLKIDTIAATHCKARWSTGQIISKQAFQYGLYEAYLKIAPAVGIDNAFWLTSQGDLKDGTGDSFEIDIAETYYPSLIRSTLHRHNLHAGGDRYETGYDNHVRGNLASGFHDYGVLWTADALIFCLDGNAFQTVETQKSISVPANLRLSTALGDFGGPPPADPVGLAMQVKHVRVVALA